LYLYFLVKVLKLYIEIILIDSFLDQLYNRFFSSRDREQVFGYLVRVKPRNRIRGRGNLIGKSLLIL
jgi:hypothetical protein